MLPGGKPNSAEQSRPWQLAHLRVALLASELRHQFGATPAAAVEVRRLRYRLRGWNAPRLDALDDARTALDSIMERFDARNVILVGHSMGGRVAVHLAAEQPVGAIVALAPWWPADDAVLVPSGTRLLAVHGTADTWTDPAASRRQIDRARNRGVDADWVGLVGADHFLLRRRRNWTTLTAGLIRTQLGV